ncbi:MAG: EpsG family protein [Muribaculaceae bacterium]|nr:EpsG family protein [Muribaculaceae bacterium]
MEYLIPVVLTLIGMFLNSRLNSETPKKVLLAIIILTMIVIMGLRFRVGTDTIMYMDRFEKFPTLDTIFSRRSYELEFEPIYTFLCICLKTITPEFWPVQVMASAISTTCITIFLYRTCKNVFLGVFFYLIFQWLYFSVEIMRESIAIGIFLLNFRNLEEKKWLKYYLFCFLCMGFHYSSAITFIFPLLQYLRVNIWYIGACAAMVAITPLVENFNKFLELGFVTAKISTYIKDGENQNINWHIMEFIRNAVPAVFLLFICRKRDLNPWYRAMLLFQILLTCGSIAIPVVFQRLTNYTTIFVNIVLCNYLSDRRSTIPMRVFAASFVILSQSYYYYTLYKDRCFPYVSVIEPEKVTAREEYFRSIWKVKRR